MSSAGVIDVVEVGPRDGLQNAPVVLAPAVRAELCRRLAGDGLRRIEAVSFVNPARVPQMAGAEEVLAAAGGGNGTGDPTGPGDPTGTGDPTGMDDPDGTEFEGLVLNARGLDRAIAAGLRRIRFSVAVSDAFNRANTGAGAQEGLAAGVATVERARQAGIAVDVVVSTAFGCPFSGEVAVGDVIAFAQALADAGAGELLFADTIGVAVPRQIREVFAAADGLGPRLGAHLHDTRGTGYACAFAAIEAGAVVLDSSIGGLGGCPFAPGATGNIATEDLVWMLEREGIPLPPIDLDGLLETGRWLAATSGLTLESHLSRAGPFPASVSAAATG